MLGPNVTPFEVLGGEPAVLALVERFYDEMEAHEPELTQLHRRDDDGKVSRTVRDRFGMFLIGWLGGPQTYVERFGHPRLRMRHGHVPVSTAMRDAWLRAMKRALDASGIEGEVRGFLDRRFADLAEFMRNVPE